MRTTLATVITIMLLVGASGAAHAGVNTSGFAEAGVGVALPFADGSYRDDFDTSPTLWLAGVYLPRYGDRSLGVELGCELTPYEDSFPVASGAATDFTRIRLQLGGRYFRELAPQLTGFARALAGVEIFSWNQTGHVGTVEFDDTDAHLGLGLELGAGVLYQISSFTVGGQLAVPIGIHDHTVYDGGIEIDHTAFDLELRLTVGTSY